ncbi:MAG: hypothetical protein HOW73_02385 [Polyangiaceae bacterium]|nr:hypothetical protein [Polyangiaceae bacterium]
MSKRALSSLGSLALLVLPAIASAHTVLVNPEPLTGNDDAKTPACGCTFGGGAIECPADFQITEYMAGETITVTWNETVNHTGEFRIAFVAKPPSEVTDADFGASAVKITVDDQQAGGLVDAEITLPDTPCEECTIQVRQFMEGAQNPYYYTCAAVRILDPGGDGGAGGSSGDGGAPSTGGSGGTTSEGGAPVGSGGSTSNGNNADGEGGEPVWEGPHNDDGCGVSNAGSAGDSAWAGAIFALGAFAVARSRRKR